MAVPFALTPLYAALPETHSAAHKEHILLQDLAKDEWILFARRFHPVVHDAIMAAARREGIAPTTSLVIEETYTVTAAAIWPWRFSTSLEGTKRRSANGRWSAKQSKMSPGRARAHRA